MKRPLPIRRKVLGQLVGHAQCHPHRECCGLLAGRQGVITRAFPAENVAMDQARSYEIAPQQIVRLMREFREDRNRHGDVFYRWINEIPALPVLIGVVLLVVFKPF